MLLQKVLHVQNKCEVPTSSTAERDKGENSPEIKSLTANFLHTTNTFPRYILLYKC
jgi:hypothetical protein